MWHNPLYRYYCRPWYLNIVLFWPSHAPLYLHINFFSFVPAFTLLRANNKPISANVKSLYRPNICTIWKNKLNDGIKYFCFNFKSPGRTVRWHSQTHTRLMFALCSVSEQIITSKGIIIKPWMNSWRSEHFFFFSGYCCGEARIKGDEVVGKAWKCYGLKTRPS